MLAVADLDVYYGPRRALSRVSLSVGPGEVLCIMGRNGVGKTTLLKTLIGLLRPRTGRIAFEGRDVTGLPPWERARRGMAYVPQGREIFPRLTVRENLLVAAARRGAGDGLDYVLRLFPALGAVLDRRGGDLSGGQQQQLALARALMAEPRLLLLDEPTEGIQPSIVEEIAGALARIKAEGTRAVVLVEQDVEFARALGDRFTVMEKGAVVWEGQPAGLDDAALQRFLSV
jgi:urea transport system ATP-binding protein